MHRLATRASWISAAVLATAVVVACGSSDDDSSAPPATGGGAGAAGQSGAAGQAGTAGSAGTAGAAGTAGSAMGGSAGEAGAAGSAGQAGAAGQAGSAGSAGAAGGNPCGTDATASVVVRDMTGKAVDGVQVATNICPATTALSDSNGTASLPIPTNTPLFFELTKTGYIAGLTGEVMTGGAAPKFEPAIVPDSAKPMLSAVWTAGTSALFIYARSTVSSGACSTTDGITFSIPGMNGTMVIYSGDSGPDPSLTATTTDGVAIMLNVATGSDVFVQPTGAKAGCKVSFQNVGTVESYTGRVPAVADKITFAWAFVSP